MADTECAAAFHPEQNRKNFGGGGYHIFSRPYTALPYAGDSPSQVLLRKIWEGKQELPE